MRHLTDDNKKTLIEMQVFKVLNNIQKEANYWFEDVYIDDTLHLCDNDLILILEHQFSVGYFWTQIAQSLGFNLKAKDYLEIKYNDYKEYGHKAMISDIRYDSVKDRVRTDAEIEKVYNYQISLINDILEELKNEEE